MGAVYAETETDYYDEVAEALEEQILRLNALKVAQVPGSEAWQVYQQRIDTLTGRSLALQAVRPELERYDMRIAAARREARRAQDRADHAMDAAWLAVKFFGTVGLIGLLICMLWIPTVWLPIFTGLFLLVAVGAVVMALRSRTGLYEAADNANSASSRLAVEKQALLSRAEAGEFPLVSAVPEQRVPLSLVPKADDEVDEVDAEVVDTDVDTDDDTDDDTD